MKYTPHTPEDVERALAALGVDSVDALFEDLPEAIRDPRIDIPGSSDETALLAHLRSLAARDASHGPSFLGGGIRRHFSPAAVNALTFQSEFVTAYTPYQPEVSQGLLQAMF